MTRPMAGFSQVSKPMRTGALSILLLAMLAACGGQFLYNRIDWFTKYQIEKYVELDREQARFVAASMDSVLDWHSESELNEYVAFLDQVQQAVDGELEGEDVEQWFKEIRLAYEKLLPMMTPWLIELAGSLSPAQIEELALSMAQRNRELEDEYLSRDAAGYSQSTSKRLNRNFRYWLGPLTKKQQGRVKQTANALERLDKSWMAARKDWQGRLIDALEKPQGWRDELATLLQDGAGYSEQDSQQASERNIRRISILIAEILNTRNERQNKRLHDKLNKWRADLAAIHTSHSRMKTTALSP